VWRESERDREPTVHAWKHIYTYAHRAVCPTITTPISLKGVFLIVSSSSLLSKHTLGHIFFKFFILLKRSKAYTWNTN
jgi:hypothetical protein